MAKINIEQPHTLPQHEVKQRLVALAERLSQKYGIEARWVSDHEAEIKRTGVTGRLLCGDTNVTVRLDISFALLPLKGTIEERIRRELASNLA